MEIKIQPTNQTLYEQDYYLWLRTTINELRAGQFSSVDLDNLIEELEDIGRNHKRAVKSLLIRLFEHLLKLIYWDMERERNQGHWKGEIRTFRREIKDLLKESPSLKSYILEIFDECYQDARKEASDRSQLPIDTFPITLIGSLEQILDENWFPSHLSFVQEILRPPNGKAQLDVCFKAIAYNSIALYIKILFSFTQLCCTV